MYDPDDIDKDSQGFRIYYDDNANKLDTNIVIDTIKE